MSYMIYEHVCLGRLYAYFPCYSTHHTLYQSLGAQFCKFNQSGAVNHGQVTSRLLWFESRPECTVPTHTKRVTLSVHLLTYVGILYLPCRIGTQVLWSKGGFSSSLCPPIHPSRWGEKSSEPVPICCRAVCENSRICWQLRDGQWLYKQKSTTH